MIGIAIDFSGARIDIGLLKQSNVVRVCRYITRASGPKGLTADEAKLYIDNGIGVVPNFEDAADNALRGAGQGTQDGVFANDYCDRIGVPPNVPILYSCDTSGSYVQLAPYYKAIKAVGRRPVGYYGPMAAGLQLKSEGVVDVVWVANAASWSGYRTWTSLAADARKTAGVNMLQYVDRGQLIGVPPNAYDYNEIINDFPCWGAGGVVTPPKKQQEDNVLINPRRVRATVANRDAAVGFDLASKTFFGTNGTDFLQAGVEGTWAVTHWPANGANITASAKFVGQESGDVDWGELADGSGVFMHAKGDAGTFNLQYKGIGPDPFIQAGGSAPPPAVDLQALAAQLAPLVSKRITVSTTVSAK